MKTWYAKEWGTKDGKPATVWWRHGKASAGEPPIVTKVVTYECEDDRLNATLNATLADDPEPGDDPEPEET